MRLVPLAEIVECLDRRRVPIKESDRVLGNVPYYGANGQQGWIDRAIFNEPLVIVAEDGGHFGAPERGVAYRISGPSWVNNHGHVLRAVKGVDHDYLFHVLRNYNFAPYISGSTRSKLTQGQLMRAQIGLPSLPEQKRIAAILDHADALRAKRRQVLAHLDALTQSIFHDMFGSMDYESAPLAKVAQIWDCPHSTPKWTDTGEVCLRTPNLTRGSWNWSDTRYVDPAQFASRSKGGAAQAGDIILSREGTVGIAAIVEPAMSVCMGQRLVQVRVSGGKLIPEFALAFLLTALHPDRIGQEMVGSTAKHLNVKDLRALATPVPPLSLQEEFTIRTQRVDQQRRAILQALATADELFASLQSRAFKGDL